MLDNLIYKTLTGHDQLAGMLAKYDGQPAIFYQQAPQDTDRKWDEINYPMIAYVSDNQYNPERKSAGTLMVDVFTTKNNDLGPEDISPTIVETLSELFLTGEGTTICIVWNRTDTFKQQIRDESEPEISGNTISFDILEFPPQISVNPDPVLALNQWLKTIAPQGVFIGYDSLPESLRPTDTNPAFYWRAAGAGSVVKNTYAVAWLEAQIVGHIFCPSPAERLKWIRAITDKLAIQGFVALSDGSPMIVNRIAYNPAANPLHEGQITITGTYGVLKDAVDAPKLNHINLI